MKSSIQIKSFFYFITGFWDTRKGSQPIEVTPIEKSHRDPIFDVRFIQSKTGMCLKLTFSLFLIIKRHCIVSALMMKSLTDFTYETYIFTNVIFTWLRSYRII